METRDRGMRGIRKTSGPGRESSLSGRGLSSPSVPPAPMGRYSEDGASKHTYGAFKSFILGSQERQSFKKDVWQPKRKEFRKAATSIRHGYNQQEREIKKYFKRQEKTQEFEKIRRQFGMTEYKIGKDQARAEKDLIRKLRRDKRQALRKNAKEARTTRKDLWKSFREQNSKNTSGRASGLFGGSTL